MKVYCDDCKWSRIGWDRKDLSFGDKTIEAVTNHMECVRYDRDVNPFDSCPVGERRDG